MYQVHSGLVALLLFAAPLWAATESQLPDTIAAQSGYTDCTIAEIDEDPDSPDASWCDVADANNIATTVRVTFPTPTGPPTDGAGLQSFRVQWRKTSQSTNPSCAADLYENAVLVTANVIASTEVSSTTGTVVSGTWDSSSLSTNNGSQVEVLVTCSTGGGPAGNRASGEVGAVEWVVDYTTGGGRFKKVIIINGD